MPVGGHVKKLLIVDDAGYARESFASQLEDHYEIVVAETGEEALNKLTEADFDAVLSDIRMPPGMSGIELIEKDLRTPS